MAIKETRSNTKHTSVSNFFTMATTLGKATSIIDTANFDLGITVTMLMTPIGGNSTLTVTNIKESDDSGMAGETDIPTVNIIGNLADMTLTTLVLDNGILPSVGVIGNKRYIQVTYDITLGTATDALAIIMVNMGRESLPFTNPV